MIWPRMGTVEYADLVRAYDTNPLLCPVCKQPIPYRLYRDGARTCGGICRNELSAQNRKGQKRKPR